MPRMPALRAIPLAVKFVLIGFAGFALGVAAGGFAMRGSAEAAAQKERALCDARAEAAENRARFEEAARYQALIEQARSSAEQAEKARQDAERAYREKESKAGKAAKEIKHEAANIGGGCDRAFDDDAFGLYKRAFGYADGDHGLGA